MHTRTKRQDPTLNTSEIWIGAHKEIKLELTQKLSPFWPAFIMPEGIIYVSCWGEKILVLPSPEITNATILTCQARYTHWPDRCMTVWGITNCFLIR